MALDETLQEELGAHILSSPDDDQIFDIGQTFRQVPLHGFALSAQRELLQFFIRRALPRQLSRAAAVALRLEL